MALDPTKNFAYGLVEAGGHSAAATSFNTVTGYGAKFPATADGDFNVVWWNVTDYSNPSEDPNVEIVRVTARAGEAFTVTRAQESTSASTKNTSGKVYAIALCMTKKMVDDISTLLAASDAAVAAAVALVAGITNASTTTAGLVELATEAQALAGTATGETGAKLVVTPDVLQKVLQGATMLYAVEDGSGSDDTYTWATTPVTTARVTGSVRRVKLTVANTGACTGNENSLGALTFKKYASGALADLETGDIVANMTAYILDDGTYYVLLNPGATMPTTALLSEMATFFGSFSGTAAQVTAVTDGSTIVDKHFHKKTYGAAPLSNGSTTQTIAHGLTVTPKRIKITCHQGLAGAGTYISTGMFDGTTYACAYLDYNGGTPQEGTSTTVIVFTFTNAAVNLTATTAIDATNITLTWSNTSAAGGALLWEAEV